VTDRITVTARWYGMDMVMEESKLIRFSRQPSSIPIMMN